MNTGIARNRRIFVGLALVAPEGEAVDVEFVLDSGFTGVTTLAPAACAALELPFLRLQPAGLADGSPLLLEESDVRFQGREGGFVSIEPAIEID